MIGERGVMGVVERGVRFWMKLRMKDGVYRSILNKKRKVLDPGPDKVVTLQFGGRVLAPYLRRPSDDQVERGN